MEKSAMSGYLVWLYFVHSDACMLLVIESVYILDKHNSLITINCYLGQIMTSLDGNFSQVDGNLRKVRKSWARLLLILGGGGGGEKYIGVGDVIQGGSPGGNTFGGGDVVDDPPHGMSPGWWGGVQHRVALQITGRHPLRLLGGIWQYPPLYMEMQQAGF